MQACNSLKLEDCEVNYASEHATHASSGTNIFGRCKQCDEHDILDVEHADDKVGTVIWTERCLRDMLDVC